MSSNFSENHLFLIPLNFLEKLEKSHKYSSEGKSLLEPYFYRWWDFAISCCPLWIAPNMITLLGFIVNAQAWDPNG